MFTGRFLTHIQSQSRDTRDKGKQVYLQHVQRAECVSDDFFAGLFGRSISKQKERLIWDFSRVRKETGK